jgi:7-carboxy-7-deazaguanine synthase
VTATVTSQRSFKVSEIFESLQGEGPTAGEPALFLRLATCNLHCAYCDTKYTWDFNNYSYREEVRSMSLGQVADRLAEGTARRLVVTGGEPMLQQAALDALLRELGATWTVEVETNGTLAASSALARRVDQWNVSPKLSSSGNREGLRLRPKILAGYRDTGRAHLKLVVATEHDVAEADALVTALAWPKERVMLMPEAQTREALQERAPFVAAASLLRGWRASPRLHIERWNGERAR